MTQDDATADRDRGRTARLVELTVADPPAAWAAAGFAVEGAVTHVGETAIRLVGHDASGTGIIGWCLAGLDASEGDGDVDGLPTRFAGASHGAGAGAEPGMTAGRPPAHPNGVIGLDHVVVSTPDLDRTIAALATVGLACRRIRETTSYGSPMRQAFFRLGPTLLEVVGGGAGAGRPAAEAPAAWFGLAVDVADLDRTASLLGDGLGPVKGAVQEGRRIATFRHQALGLSVAVAAMDHHAGR